MNGKVDVDREVENILFKVLQRSGWSPQPWSGWRRERGRGRGLAGRYGRKVEL